MMKDNRNSDMSPTSSAQRSRRPPGRFLKAGLPAVTLAAVALLATACGATGGAANAPAASQSQSAALAFSECMRSHGVADFPNPGSNGQLSITPSEGNINSPQFQSALTACRSLEKGVPLKQDMGGQTTLLKYSQCMRTHGISDFPDPSATGGYMIDPSKQKDMNQSSPVFQRAQTACYKYLSAALGSEHGSAGAGAP
jgi:hypothetical protein